MSTDLLAEENRGFAEDAEVFNRHCFAYSANPSRPLRVKWVDVLNFSADDDQFATKECNTSVLAGGE